MVQFGSFLHQQKHGIVSRTGFQRDESLKVRLYASDVKRR
jgi:hypothetical protein